MVTADAETVTCLRCKAAPKHGKNSYCKPCAAANARDKYAENPGVMRAYNLRKKFGVSPVWYLAQFHFQGGKCAICKQPPHDGQRAFAVDHDHETGRPRGLLCRTCNLFVGSSFAVLPKFDVAAQYVRQSANDDSRS